jgi:hypothetical protein
VKKTLVVAFGDTHINSMVGLCPPVVKRDSGASYHASKSQRAIYDGWQDLWQSIKKNYRGWRKVVVMNGDLGELDTNRRSVQLITPNKAYIQRLCNEVLAPAVEAANQIIVLRGTSAHTGKSAWLEEALAGGFTRAKVIKSEEGTSSHWHFRGVIAEKRFDICHHASMGYLPQTEKMAASKIANIILQRYYVNLKAPPPDLAWRAHNHRRSDSGQNFETFVSCLPCFSGATEFVYRIGHENDPPDIGADVVEINRGELKWIPYKYEIEESREIWSVNL